MKPKEVDKVLGLTRDIQTTAISLPAKERNKIYNRCQKINIIVKKQKV